MNSLLLAYSSLYLCLRESRKKLKDAAIGGDISPVKYFHVNSMGDSIAYNLLVYRSDKVSSHCFDVESYNLTYTTRNRSVNAISDF